MAARDRATGRQSRGSAMAENAAAARARAYEKTKTAEILLNSHSKSVSEEESQAREKRFDHAEKAHRGVSWTLRRSARKANQ